MCLFMSASWVQPRGGVASAGCHCGSITLLTKGGHTEEQHIHHLASSRPCGKDNTHCSELTFACGAANVRVCACVCVKLMVLDPCVVEVSDGDIPQILSRQLGKL